MKLIAPAALVLGSIISGAAPILLRPYSAYTISGIVTVAAATISPFLMPAAAKAPAALSTSSRSMP